jgi:hypothetical protein
MPRLVALAKWTLQEVNDGSLVFWLPTAGGSSAAGKAFKTAWSTNSESSDNDLLRIMPLSLSDPSCSAVSTGRL